MKCLSSATAAPDRVEDMTQESIRVLVVEDYHVARQGVLTLLGATFKVQAAMTAIRYGIVPFESLNRREQDT